LHRLLVVLFLLDSVVTATSEYFVSVCSFKHFEDKNSKKDKVQPMTYREGTDRD
jgi:hypothetical protein